MTIPPGIPGAVWQDVLAAVDLADRLPAPDEGELARRLYADWYLAPASVRDDRPAAPGPVDLDLVDALRAAHADTARWLSGWTVEATSSRGRVAVRQDGRRRVVARVDVLPLRRPCLAPRAGDPVRVGARRDTVDETRAFWFAYGGGWDETAVPAGLVRLYWHAPRRATPSLVGALTGELARAGCSYALKVAVEDRDVDRPDRAVLYLTADALAAAAPAIRAAYRGLRRQLWSSVPRLAQRLGHGLAVAEDPGGGESFGEHRCRLVAAGLARTPRQGSRRARAAALLERLADAGLDPARPHLQPGSERDYRWLLT